MGVSKTQPAELLAELVRAGLRHVGENRVQEAADKFPRLPGAARRVAEPPVRHMIGHLQINKAGQALELFERVDSVDSVKLGAGTVAAWRRAERRRLRGPASRSTSATTRRGLGCGPLSSSTLVGQILRLPALRVDGLMTVAPLGATRRGTRLPRCAT